ncbi:RNA polymerase sigma factor [Humisphaera borealis]|uniref:Sigma-70 family RNA polymerase sigma factor n=1 Tax=Humisphaera borealis TaxID=2807512 RepID=A0A7M2X4T2_9BACT|nr:sigma-70 family RNA polymerase sigma factor [Humisphaera borealis]QOV92061.1 sigma-70 family RNA polymerase sigma factor [Humisphaera borealis]
MKLSEAKAAQAFLAHHGFVKGLALRHAPLPGIADDILQQVFVEFLAKADQWDLDRDVKPLLATMTRTVALRHWRDKTRDMPEVVQKLAEHVRMLAEERSAAPRYADEIAVLRSCVEKLPDKSRALIDLYYYDDISTPQIADRLGMKADTVCRAMGRLREKLRECIDRGLKSALPEGGVAHG